MNLKKYYLLLVSLFIFAMESFGAIPTVEGLFRNINNKDIEGSIIIVNFQIKKVQKKLDPSEVTSHAVKQEHLEILEKEKQTVRYIKVFLSIENPKRIEYLKIEFDDISMNHTSIQKISYFPNILEEMSKDQSVERRLFISILNMLTLNDSRGISAFLSRYNTNYQSNKMSINEKKKLLLSQYKQYLEKINENKELKEEIQSPLKSEDLEKKEKIDEVLQGSMYVKSKNVFLYKEKKKFFWKVQLDSITALFDNESLKLKRVMFQSGGGAIKMYFGEYILFDGIHELPKVIYFKDLLEKSFQIRVSRYKVISKLSKSIEKRYKEMNENFLKRKESQSKMSENQMPGSEEIFSLENFLY